jgi:hypothetical protein
VRRGGTETTRPIQMRVRRAGIVSTSRRAADVRSLPTTDFPTEAYASACADVITRRGLIRTVGHRSQNAVPWDGHFDGDTFIADAPGPNPARTHIHA